MLAHTAVLAQESFWPTSAGGWIPLLAFAAAILGGGWAGVRKITRAIDNINAIPVHTAEIADVKAKVEDLDDGQLAVLAELRTISEGMVTAAEMTTHTQQDAAMFDTLSGRLTSIDGRLGRVEAHAGIERTDPEDRTS